MDVENEYLKLLPVPEIPERMDGAGDIFPGFYKLYLEARYTYLLGFYDVCGTAVRISLEYLLRDYIGVYCREDISDKRKLESLVNKRFRSVCSDRAVHQALSDIQHMGNKCAHYGTEISKSEIDGVFGKLEDVYVYLAHDVCGCRFIDLVTELCEVQEKLMSAVNDFLADVGRSAVELLVSSSLGSDDQP